MIIKDIAQIDHLAEQMFSHTPNLIAIDINDYNRIKTHSAYLNATSVQLPFFVKENIVLLERAIKEFNPEGVYQILLQICGVSSSLEIHNITLNEMNSILGVIEEYFGKVNVSEKVIHHMGLKVIEKRSEKVNIVWGLSNRKSTEINGYEIYIIVGYRTNSM